MEKNIRPHFLASLGVMALFSAAAVAAPPPQAQQPQDQNAAPHPLAWAYAVPPAPLPPPPAVDETAVKQIPGSTPSFTMKQMADFKNGARKTADPGKRNTAVMSGNAAGITDEEAKAAAEYFSSMKMTPWIKVVETETVPKNRNGGGFYVPVEGKEPEPIGQRILEMPVDPDATETYRNPRSGWIAYAPMGSVKKGEELVLRGGSGKTVACAACHGEGLKGNGNFPPLAGRSPSYLARQLYDMQKYARNGPGTQVMSPIVQNLSEDDIRAITAYLASLEP